VEVRLTGNSGTHRILSKARVRIMLGHERIAEPPEVGEAGEARSFDTAERARQFAAAERITDVFVVNTDGAEERIVPLPWPTLDAA
jgi:hypothetical protein